MFAHLPARHPGVDAVEALMTLITKNDELKANPRIPAGYTYLGQFIDHDITFDPTSQLEKVNDPLALENFRTPRLDLDSVYGAGPQDQPFLYESLHARDRGVKLLVGRSADEESAVDDLPRNQQGRALVGDARNDENLVVAQLHLLFVKFHNAVVDHVRRCDGLEGAELLYEAQRTVRWHYQWIVAHDFLERIVGETMAQSVLRPRGALPPVERRFFHWEGEPFIPVEFSGAAYRFGHSMVRKSYEVADGRSHPIFADSDHPDPEDHLGGLRRLPPKLAIDWSFFFAVPFEQVSDNDNRPQASIQIDTVLAKQLFKLPRGVSAEREALPLLNLRRSRALGLPAGRDVARAMGEPELTDKQLGLPADIDPQQVGPAEREALLRATPLWYYILCEAAARHGGLHLGHVGGRIVAEVLVGLIEADPHSYLSRAPVWLPELPRATEDDFTMVDLICFTLGTPPRPAAEPLPGPGHA